MLVSNYNMQHDTLFPNQFVFGVIAIYEVLVLYLYCIMQGKLGWKKRAVFVSFEAVTG